MIDPSSIGDWAQAFFLTVTLAGAAALFVRALRAEETRVPVRVPETAEVEPLDEAPLAAV